MTDKYLARKIMQNPRLYSALFLKIKDRNGKIVPFVWNSCQRYMASVIYFAHRMHVRFGIPMRFLVLKPRQPGATTFFQGLGFHAAATTPGINATVFAHDRETAKSVLDKSNLFLRNLPPKLRPRRGSEQRYTIEFAGLESKFTIGTAGTEEAAAVGRTFNFVHGTEGGLWARGGYKTMSALKECVPVHGFLSVESTAYDPEGVFYDEWHRCRDNLRILQSWLRNGARGRPKTEGDFIPIFFPWYLHDEYRIPLFEGESLEPYSQEEKKLLKEGLRPDQIKWRRWKDTSTGGERHRWYPENDTECWYNFEASVIPSLSKTKHWKKAFKITKDKFWIVGGIDFGADHPFTYVRIAIDKETYDVFVFSEYGRRDVLAYDQINEIKKGREEGSYPDVIFADPSGRQARLELLAGGRGVRTYRADNDVDWSIRLIKTLLSDHPKTGKPQLYIMNTCPRTFDQMRSYSRKSLGGGLFGAIRKKDDDFVDAFRYAIYSMWCYWRRMNRSTPWDRVIQEDSPDIGAHAEEGVFTGEDKFLSEDTQKMINEFTVRGITVDDRQAV